MVPPFSPHGFQPISKTSIGIQIKSEKKYETAEEAMVEPIRPERVRSLILETDDDDDNTSDHVYRQMSRATRNQNYRVICCLRVTVANSILCAFSSQ